ncbi:MAG: hypothetical protein ACI4IT_05355 [Oscillospiraceae bacterium]
MKKFVCLFLVLVLVLVACSKPAEGGDLSTESSSSGSEQQASYKPEEAVTAMPEALRTFWESSCGKEILSWQAEGASEPNYSLYLRDLGGGYTLYYCYNAVYIGTPDGIENIIDQVSVDPESILFRDGKLYIPFESGNWRYVPGNFPYFYVYDIEEKSAGKEVYPLNGASMQHTAAGSVTGEISLGKINIDADRASIYFDIDTEAQGGGLDSYFPQIEYFFDAHTGISTFYIAELRYESGMFDALEGISGVSSVSAGAFEQEPDGIGTIKGTVLSFTVDDGYTLYAETFANWETSPEDHFDIWTEKK